MSDTGRIVTAFVAGLILSLFIGWPLGCIAGLVILVGLTLEHGHRVHAQEEPERIKRAVLEALEEQQANKEAQEERARERREADILASCPHQPTCYDRYSGWPGPSRQQLIESLPEACRDRSEQDARLILATCPHQPPCTTTLYLRGEPIQGLSLSAQEAVELCQSQSRIEQTDQPRKDT